MADIVIELPGPTIRYGSVVFARFRPGTVPVAGWKAELVVTADETSITDIPLDVPDRTMLHETRSLSVVIGTPFTLKGDGSIWTGGGGTAVLRTIDPDGHPVGDPVSFRVLP